MELKKLPEALDNMRQHYLEGPIVATVLVTEQGQCKILNTEQVTPATPQPPQPQEDPK